MGAIKSVVPIITFLYQCVLSAALLTLNGNFSTKIIWCGNKLISLVLSGNPDILICGNCRELFNDIVDMLEHKKIYCKMRFTCKCDENIHTEQGKCSPTKHSEPTNKGKDNV